MVCAIGIVPMSRRRPVGIVCIAEARDGGLVAYHVRKTAIRRGKGSEAVT